MVGSEAGVHAWRAGAIITNLPILSVKIHQEDRSKAPPTWGTDRRAEGGERCSMDRRPGTQAIGAGRRDRLPDPGGTARLVYRLPGSLRQAGDGQGIPRQGGL